MKELQQTIENIYNNISSNPDLLKNTSNVDTVRKVISLLNNGTLRVATPPPPEGSSETWTVHSWVKMAILLYFRTEKMETLHAGEMEYWDKIPLKKNYSKEGVRVVPPAVARYGSFISPGAVLMPSYVNIGAYVDTRTMVDTWATVGSCAQIGKNVHLSGGVGIGGVLEPPQADPVIIENNAFLGSRCIVVEGVRVCKGAVLGSGVILTQSTKIIDVSNDKEVITKGEIPENSVVIPGTIPKVFPAGTYQVPCVLIIGKRKASTDLKTSLNDALRDFKVAV